MTSERISPYSVAVGAVALVFVRALVGFECVEIVAGHLDRKIVAVETAVVLNYHQD